MLTLDELQFRRAVITQYAIVMAAHSDVENARVQCRNAVGSSHNDLLRLMKLCDEFSSYLREISACTASTPATSPAPTKEIESHCP